MSWINYYNLYVKYKGNLNRANKEEMEKAAESVTDPTLAQQEALEKYQQNYPKKDASTNS